jgi:hypothetical protein
LKQVFANARAAFCTIFSWQQFCNHFPYFFFTLEVLNQYSLSKDKVPWVALVLQQICDSVETSFPD